MTIHRFVASFFFVTAAVALGGPLKTEKAPVTAGTRDDTDA